MLRGGNPLTVGVGTVIEVIRKNNSDYDMDNGAPEAVPSSNDPIYLGSLLRNFAKHVPDFMDLILSPTHTVPDGESTTIKKRDDLSVAFGSRIEPLGFDRFKTCELMAELLHCSNMGLLNERGSEAYVRQRDAERDRRKAEGSLTASRPPTSTLPENSEDGGDVNGSSVETAVNSFDEGRKLEVMNNAEDDGFEDVGTSAELEDDIKEDFDEKDTFELENKPAQVQSPRKQVRPRLDLDEEFVDEPLTSPKFGASNPNESNPTEAPVTDFGEDPKTASPVDALTEEVADLTVEKDTSPADEGSVTFPAFQKDEPSAPAPLNVHSSTEAPPLPVRQRSSQPKSPDVTTPPEVFSQPNDKPAPLFAKRAESESQDPSSDQSAHPGTDHGFESQETIDTTLGEEGDSARSMNASNGDQTFEPQMENDDNGEPLVGDLLKMMFVEHKVVPTILVSLPLQRVLTSLTGRMIGFLLSIPLEQFSSQCSI